MPPKKTVTINTAAKAILPDGTSVDRAVLLQKLGLNPATPPDAWLNVIGCGSNASALHIKDAKVLLDRGAVKKTDLGAKLTKDVEGIR